MPTSPAVATSFPAQSLHVMHAASNSTYISSPLEPSARSHDQVGELTESAGDHDSLTPCASTTTEPIGAARSVIDLEKVHGCSELKLGLTFPTGTAATKFMQDYTFNTNRKCILKKGSGGSNTYGCKDSSCNWEVRVTKRKNRDGTTCYYVSMMHAVHHDFCTSTAKPTERQIQLLPTFLAAVRSDRAIKRKALVAIVQERDMTNLQECRSKMYRAKDTILRDSDGTWAASFSLVPSLLSELKKKNPGSTVYLDVDQHRRFFRAFLAFGVNVSSQEALIPVTGFDGTHSKHLKYNGVILSLIGRDGNGQNVTLAIALVHSENKTNIMWFLDLCTKSGIATLDRPTFCDRGKIREAVAERYMESGALMHLRFCTVHILRNIKRKYQLSGTVFENKVWAAQQAESEREYLSALEQIQKAYGAAVTRYLTDISPRMWTVYSNTAGQDSSAAQFRSIPTEPLPLFGWRTTNFVESDNSAMLVHGIRDATPLDAFRLMASVEMERLSSRDLLATKWLQEGRVLTPHGKALWEKERSRVGQYHIRRSTASIYFASVALSTKYRRVDTSRPSCSCSTFDQYRIACRHIVAVFYFVHNHGGVMRAFHPSYFVANYAAAFLGKGIELPLLENCNVNLSILPPPYYKQPGRPQTKRIESAGEAPSSSTYKCRTCTGYGHNKRTCRRHTNQEDEIRIVYSPTAMSLGEECDEINNRQEEALSTVGTSSEKSAHGHHPPSGTGPADNRMSLSFLAS